MFKLMKIIKIKLKNASFVKRKREIICYAKQAAKDSLNSHGLDEKGLSKFDQFKTYIMINIQTLADKSSSHIAEMLIIGSNMGIIDAIKKQREYKDAEEAILKLISELQKSEEKNVKKLKKFL